MSIIMQLKHSVLKSKKSTQKSILYVYFFFLLNNYKQVPCLPRQYELTKKVTQNNVFFEIFNVEFVIQYVL